MAAQPNALAARSGWWHSNTLLTVTAVTLSILIPAMGYAVIGAAIPASLLLVQDVIAIAYVLTAAMTILEALAATGSRTEPAPVDQSDAAALVTLPSLSVIISAYLPNEQRLVVETIVRLATGLRVAPGKLQIILAYNTPEVIPDVEDMLHSLGDLNVAFTPLRVLNSHSKAENVNAALALVTGDVTLMLDADHHPAADSAVLALRWFAQGYDIVQGRCVIRDEEDSWFSRMIAVEFEEMYGVAHAGRSLAFGTAMFCGSNGWWRTSVLREIGMNSAMLTEDIDSSVRALLGGYRAIHDRAIVSTELAPPTAKAWWNQRTRWAQGWFQVTLKYERDIRHSSVLNSRLKLYWSYLLSWRQMFPVLSLQVFSILLADAFLAHPLDWFQSPFLALATVITIVAGPFVSLITYKVSLSHRKREMRRAYLAYGLTSLLYTTVKNAVAISSSARELLGRRSWIVTHRSNAVVAMIACLAVGGLASPHGAQAATDGPTTIALEPLGSSMILAGRAPVSTFTVQVPHDWTAVAGTLILRWQASTAVRGDSTLAVSIDGSLVGTQPLSSGPGGFVLPIPVQAIPGHVLQIQLAAQLHSQSDPRCCASDSASGAFLTLDPSTAVLTLNGLWNPVTPQLSQAPGVLVDSVGARSRTLFVALPLNPTAAEVRAAAAVVGAVDRAAGFSVPVGVVFGRAAGALHDLPGHVIDVIGSGAPHVSLFRLANGHLVLTVAGSGDGVVTAAAAIAGTNRGYMPGTFAAVPTGTGFGTAAAPAAQVPIAGAAAQGTGPLTVNSSFQLPQSRQLTGGVAHVRLAIGFDAPAGGRIALSMNGFPLAALNLPTQGRSQIDLSLAVVQDPAEATSLAPGVIPAAVDVPLYSGANVITLTGNLPAGQPLGGTGDAEAPSVQALPGGSVTYASTQRRLSSNLALWPWPFVVPGQPDDTTFVVPARPTAPILAGIISTIATAALWTQAPFAPDVDIGPTELPVGNLVILTPSSGPSPALPSGAPTRWRSGLLETYVSGGRQVFVAAGLRALVPLERDYATDKVAGSAAMIAADGSSSYALIPASVPLAFRPRGLDWYWPAAIIVLGVLLLVAVRLRRVQRTLRRSPDAVPTTVPAPDSPMAADLHLWEALVARELSAATVQDPPTQP